MWDNLYNHESPRRTGEYVTKKIVQAACRIAKNKQKVLKLGDIDQGIDWDMQKIMLRLRGK